jgi:predicted alpha/beta-fold hydrolase
VLAARTFREFDDAATAPLHGFRDADHYYTASSSAHYLAGIRVPTLLLHSADDPFLPSDAIPRAAARDNPFITAAFTEHGGHVGFVAGTPWAPEFWAEAEAARFLGEKLNGK